MLRRYPQVEKRTVASKHSGPAIHQACEDEPLVPRITATTSAAIPTPIM